MVIVNLLLDVFDDFLIFLQPLHQLLHWALLTLLLLPVVLQPAEDRKRLIIWQTSS